MSEQNAGLDLMNNGQARGTVAQELMANGKLDIGSMRPFFDPQTKQAYMSVYTGGDPLDSRNYDVAPINHATLRRDEWKRLDEDVINIAESRLRGVQDLVDNGLTFNLNNPMATTVLENHDMSDAGEAEMTMDGIQRTENDRPNYETSYLPIPIIHFGYEINRRTLEASRKLGNGIDTTMAQRASRKVSEKLENMLFTSTKYEFGGGIIYSYLNHPHRNTVTLSTAWGASAKNPSDIKDDVISMKQASIDQYYFGPWMLYVPTSYETVLDDDYDVSGASSQTIRQRLTALEGINGVKVIDTLPADTVVLVQMTSDVVRLVRGMGIQNVEWREEGNFVTKYKVMTIQVPQIRSDQEGKTGVVVLSLS